MTPLTYPIQIRWADIDANRHLRHSAYYDFGATMRIAILTERGLTIKKLEELRMGPVLFREEAVFKREIVYEDEISLTIELVKARSDFSRWSLRHQFIKKDGAVAAILNLDGAWINLDKRKLTIPDPLVQEIFSKFPKAEGFEMIA